MRLLLAFLLSLTLAHAAVTPGGGGTSGGGPTNGITSAQATNIVTALITNKVDNLNGRSTNLFATNFLPVGDIKATNVSLLTWHRENTNTSHITYFSFGDNGGATLRSWSTTVSTNQFTIASRQSIGRNHIQLHRNNTGNVTLGEDTSSTTTNAGNLRVLGTAYDANGNPYSTNTSGGAQTPWISDINAAGYSLTNAGSLWGGGSLIMDQAVFYPDSNEVGIAIQPVTGAGNLVAIKDTNFVDKFIITPDGKVGIATNAPAQAFEVQGNVNVSGAITNGSDLAVGGNIIIRNTAGTATDMRLDGAANALYISGGNGVGGISGTQVRIRTALGSAAEADRFIVDTNGNAGVGTTSPLTTLDVNGAITMRTNLPSAAWTNGIAGFWNSNGAVYLRTSRVAGTNWIDNFMFAAP